MAFSARQSPSAERHTWRRVRSALPGRAGSRNNEALLKPRASPLLPSSRTHPPYTAPLFHTPSRPARRTVHASARPRSSLSRLSALAPLSVLSLSHRLGRCATRATWLEPGLACLHATVAGGAPEAASLSPRLSSLQLSTPPACTRRRRRRRAPAQSGREEPASGRVQQERLPENRG
jgi:hypothetical protein